MNVSMRSALVATYLTTGACHRIEPDIDAESGKNERKTSQPTDAVKLPDEASLEKSKRDAVARFPDLGIAGSELNKAFLARVNHLKAMGSPELNEWNWPYLIAVRLDQELKWAKETAELDKREKMKQQALSTQFFTVAELLQQKNMPLSEILLAGTVTKVDVVATNKRIGSILLDNKVKCEFEMSMLNSMPTDGKLKAEFEKRGDSIFTTYTARRNAQVLFEGRLFTVGQRVRLLGRAQVKGIGNVVFKIDPTVLAGMQYSGAIAP